MKYNGCMNLTTVSGAQYTAVLTAGALIGDDGVVYKSDGALWQRDPTVSPGPAPVQEPTFILPTDSAERKKVPLWSGLFRYFPDALVAVARLSWVGNEKHNKGQPLHWSRDKSNDHADCLLRHQMDTGTGEVDPDSKELHEVEVAWRALAQAQLALERQRQGGKR